MPKTNEEKLQARISVLEGELAEAKKTTNDFQLAEQSARLESDAVRRENKLTQTRLDTTQMVLNLAIERARQKANAAIARLTGQTDMAGEPHSLGFFHVKK